MKPTFAIALTLAVMMIFILPVVVQAQSFEKPTISVEEIFYPGDPLHFYAGDHKAGDKVKVSIFDSSGKKVNTSEAAIYLYGDHEEFDLILPDVAPGYYVVKWDDSKSDRLRIVKPPK